MQEGLGSCQKVLRKGPLGSPEAGEGAPAVFKKCVFWPPQGCPAGPRCARRGENTAFLTLWGPEGWQNELLLTCGLLRHLGDAWGQALEA